MSSRKSGGRLIESKVLAEEFLAKEMSRRSMVRSVMLGAVGTWLGARGLAACGPAIMNATDSGIAPVDSGTPWADATPDVPPAPTPHLVGMGYHASDSMAALMAALAETTGLAMIRPGDSVCLRVNSNSGDPYPYSTSPERIVQIGEMLRDLGVTDLRIGDHGFWGDPNTAHHFIANGIAEAATSLGTEAVVYDGSVDWMTLPAGMVPNWAGTVRLPVSLLTATHIINVGCVKTHFIATVTMALKLCLGVVHPSDRARVGNLDNHVLSRLWPQIAQINKGFTPSLNILDGYRAVISGGPTRIARPPAAPASFTEGIVGDPKIIIATTDRIAADVTGIAVLRTLSPAYEEVMRWTPFQNPQVRAAIAAGGLGIGGADAYDLSGPTVPRIEEYRTQVIG